MNFRIFSNFFVFVSYTWWCIHRASAGTNSYCNWSWWQFYHSCVDVGDLQTNKRIEKQYSFSKRWNNKTYNQSTKQTTTTTMTTMTILLLNKNKNASYWWHQTFFCFFFRVRVCVLCVFLLFDIQNNNLIKFRCRLKVICILRKPFIRLLLPMSGNWLINKFLLSIWVYVCVDLVPACIRTRDCMLC